MKRFGFAVVAAVMLLCCGCGSFQDAEASGRYVEEQVEIKGKIGACTGILQEEDQIRTVEEVSSGAAAGEKSAVETDQQPADPGGESITFHREKPERDRNDL